MNPNISSDRYQTFAKLATHPLREALMFQNGIILDNIKSVFTMCKKHQFWYIPASLTETNNWKQHKKCDQDVVIFFLIWTQRFELRNFSLWEFPHLKDISRLRQTHVEGRAPVEPVSCYKAASPPLPPQLVLNTSVVHTIQHEVPGENSFRFKLFHDFSALTRRIQFYDYRLIFYSISMSHDQIKMKRTLWGSNAKLLAQCQTN